MTIFIVTAFGPMIDTTAEVFPTEESAIAYVLKRWRDIEHGDGCKVFVTPICGDGSEFDLDEYHINRDDGLLWRTDDECNQNIEWQIHERIV